MSVFLHCLSGPICKSLYYCIDCINSFSPSFQRDPFIQMYEERTVDVAGYVCRILDQMPASPSSPMYMDW